MLEDNIKLKSIQNNKPRIFKNLINLSKIFIFLRHFKTKKSNINKKTFELDKK